MLHLSAGLNAAPITDIPNLTVAMGKIPKKI